MPSWAHKLAAGLALRPDPESEPPTGLTEVQPQQRAQSFSYGTNRGAVVAWGIQNLCVWDNLGACAAPARTCSLPEDDECPLGALDGPTVEFSLDLEIRRRNRASILELPYGGAGRVNRRVQSPEVERTPSESDEPGGDRAAAMHLFVVQDSSDLPPSGGVPVLKPGYVLVPLNWGTAFQEDKHPNTDREDDSHLKELGCRTTGVSEEQPSPARPKDGAEDEDP